MMSADTTVPALAPCRLQACGPGRAPRPRARGHGVTRRRDAAAGNFQKLHALAQLAAETERLRTDRVRFGEKVRVTFVRPGVKRKKYMPVEDLETHDGIVVGFEEKQMQRGVKTMLWVLYPQDLTLELHDANGMHKDGLWQWGGAVDT